MAVVILVLTFWPDVLGATVGKWVVAIAAVIVLVSAWFGMKSTCEAGEEGLEKKPKKKK